jgi:hypothetical protein
MALMREDCRPVANRTVEGQAAAARTNQSAELHANVRFRG